MSVSKTSSGTDSAGSVFSCWEGVKVGKRVCQKIDIIFLGFVTAYTVMKFVINENLVSSMISRSLNLRDKEFN